MLFQFVFCINCTVSFCKPCKFALIKSWLLYAHIHLRVGSREILECRNSGQGVLMSQSQLSVEEQSCPFLCFCAPVSTQKMVVVTYWGVVTVPKVCSFQDVSCLLKNHVEQSFPFLCFCALVKHSKDVRVGSG